LGSRSRQVGAHRKSQFRATEVAEGQHRAAEVPDFGQWKSPGRRINRSHGRSAPHRKSQFLGKEVPVWARKSPARHTVISPILGNEVPAWAGSPTPGNEVASRVHCKKSPSLGTEVPVRAREYTYQHLDINFEPPTKSQIGNQHARSPRMGTVSLCTTRSPRRAPCALSSKAVAARIWMFRQYVLLIFFFFIRFPQDWFAMDTAGHPMEQVGAFSGKSQVLCGGV